MPCIHEGTIIGELMDDPRTKEIVLDALHRYVLGSSEQIDPVTLYNMSLRHARFNSRGAFREEYMEETLKRLNHAVRGGK